MKTANSKFGLVLTGGGAKGAYQAGALMYLAQLGLEPQIIAGTSIGALNGAVLSSYHPFTYAVERLNQLWDQLGQSEILRHSTGAIHVLGYAAQMPIREWILNFLVQSEMLKDSTAIFDPTPIEHLLREAVNPTRLRRGIELWVTVFPSLKVPGLPYNWLLDFVRAKTGCDSHWLCVQDVTDDVTLYNLLLASAALPIAFPCRKVNDKFYVDGALADNVPLKALAARGCTHAIVIHLQNGVAWSRHDFPEQTIIEIKPEQPINKFDTPLLGSVSSLLDFSAERIRELKARGYEDAKRCLAPIIQTFLAVKNQRMSHNTLVNSTQRLLNDLPL